MVIQKPAPAEPAVAEVKPPRAREPAPKPPPPRVQPVRKQAPEHLVVSPPTQSAGALRLEPAVSSQTQASTQRQVNSLQRGIEARIERLKRLKLPGADRKTLEDAHTFVAQSEEAMQRGDLAQASNLAGKAELLVQAVEKRQ